MVAHWLLFTVCVLLACSFVRLFVSSVICLFLVVTVAVPIPKRIPFEERGSRRSAAQTCFVFVE